MRARLLHEAHGLRTFAAVFDKGDEPIGLLTELAGRERLTGSYASDASARFWSWFVVDPDEPFAAPSRFD